MGKIYGYTSPYYDNAEFAVATATSDYDVKANQSNLFGGDDSFIALPYFIKIVTDQTITVKLNEIINDSITITSSNSPFMLDELIEVRKIFITNNSGNTANIKILTAKPIEK